MRSRVPTFAGSVLAMVLLLVLTGCVPEPPREPEPDPDPDPTPVDLGQIDVESAPEVPRAASATLGTTGGSIEATGTDGTRYRLVVPPGALTEDVEITVTPAAIGGLGEVADDVAAGVELAPSGLEFVQSAFLEVELPPGRVLPAGAVFSSTHRSDVPGIELPPATVSEDATVVTVQVDHFSSAAVWTGTLAQLDTLWEAAWQDMPELDQLTPGFVAAATAAVGAVGTPQADATASVYVTEAVKVYQEVVVPLIAVGDASIDDAVAARKAAVRFAGNLSQVEALGVETADLAVPIGTAENVEMLGPLALDQVVDAIGRLRATYLPPQCSAQVVTLTDWLNLPYFLGLAMDFTVNQDEIIPTAFCVRPVAGGPAFDPLVLDQEDRFVEVAADVVTSVPAQTPLPTGTTTRPLGPGRVGVVGPAQLEATATGGAFRQGDATVETLTESSPDGSFVGMIDRGEDPDQRSLELSVQGRFRLSGPAGVLDDAAILVDDWNTVSIGGGIDSNELGLQVVRWDGLPDAPDVPVDERILEPGGTTNVCVEVRDRLGATVAGIAVGFSTEGPGEIDNTPKVTEESDFTNGVACAEYQHPDGPVPEGLTARIEVEAQQDADIGRTTIVLQPREADVRLSARVLPDGAFVPVASNGSFPTSAGEAVEVRATLRGSGDSPADPLVPIPDGELVATLDEGNGILTVDGTPAVPLGLSTGPEGTATFRWEPNGDDPAVIRVAHPATGPGVAATVTVGPDPTTIDGDVTVRTDAEVAALEGVTHITGTLTIGIFNRSIDPTISTVTDLTPLDSLTTIGGNLRIVDNPGLDDLDGLDSVVSVRQVYITSNASLTGLEALGSLQSVQSVIVGLLPLLTDLDGLQGLTTVPGQLTIANNPALADITALSGIEGTVGDLIIVRNLVLTTLDGLQGITTVDGILSIDGPALTSLEGLAALTTITGEVEITNSPFFYSALTTFSLPSLTSIGENLTITGASRTVEDGIVVDATPGTITTFHFPALTNIGRRFRINDHRAGADLQIVVSAELRVARSMEVFGNGGGAEISVSVDEVDWGLAVTSNDDARIELTIDRVIQDLAVQYNTDTDLQLDVGSVSRNVQIGGTPRVGNVPGNVGVALSGLRIDEVGDAVFVVDNVGFTDDQAVSWAQDIDGNPFVSASRNRLE